MTTWYSYKKGLKLKTMEKRSDKSYLIDIKHTRAVTPTENH